MCDLQEGYYPYAFQPVVDYSLMGTAPGMQAVQSASPVGEQEEGEQKGEGSPMMNYYNYPVGERAWAYVQYQMNSFYPSYGQERVMGLICRVYGNEYDYPSYSPYMYPGYSVPSYTANNNTENMDQPVEQKQCVS